MTTTGGWCSGETNVGFTDPNGVVVLDTGCWTNAHITYSVNAVGYQSSSGESEAEIGVYPTQVNVALNAVQKPNLFGCPLGYQNIAGECVQSSQAGGGILGFLEQNWLFLLVIVAVIVFIILLFLNPTVIQMFTGK